MVKAFISSVIESMEEIRVAAARGAELMGYKPVLAEKLAARPHSPQIACLTEVDNCDAFLLILSTRYGYVSDKEIAVTEEEFERAKSRGKPILIFIHDVEMEPKQFKFRRRVESYEAGFFRKMFSSPEELKDLVVEALRKLYENLESITEDEASKLFEESRNQLTRIVEINEPNLMVGLLPQPPIAIDIISQTDRLNQMFTAFSNAGLCDMRKGYDSLEEANFTGLRSGSFVYAIFENGVELFLMDPADHREGLLFSDKFVPPKNISKLSGRAISLTDATTAWVRVALYGMDECCVAEHPGGNSISFGSFLGRQINEKYFDRYFLPVVSSEVERWVNSLAVRFSRIFKQ